VLDFVKECFRGWGYVRNNRLSKTLKGSIMYNPHLGAHEAHLNHPLFINALQLIDEAGQLIQADPNILVRLKRPKRVISVSVPVRMDNQKVQVFTGYRVQYNSTLGPYKGGIRYHQDVTLGEVTGLACLMMLKNSVLGLPYGGGKGGISVDATQLSRAENQALTRRFTSELGPFIGPNKDIPAPDMGTNAQTMAWMMDTFSQEHGYSQAGVVTGKPVEIGGSLGRLGATGLGVIFVTERLLLKNGLKISDQTIAIQGFGNVGSHAALYAYERGAKILAVSDVGGGLFNGEGLDIPALVAFQKEHKTIVGFPGAQTLTNEELLALDVDVLLPCALEGVIHGKNCHTIKARFIGEGANGPLTNEASKFLYEKGVQIAPDIIANGGGVIVSYFEWVQDIMSFFWDEEDIQKKLSSIIVKAFDEVWTMSQEKKVDLRSSAMAVAIHRLQKAMLLRGLYPR
jgi:glutamate dehydrogenase (NAD(P)+)